MLAHSLPLAALALASAAAWAADDFTISDGNWSFTHSGLNGGRFGSSGGGYALENSLAANPGQLWL